MVIEQYTYFVLYYSTILYLVYCTKTGTKTGGLWVFIFGREIGVSCHDVRHCSALRGTRFVPLRYDGTVGRGRRADFFHFLRSVLEVLA